MFHECDEECQQLHLGFLQKLYGIIQESRINPLCSTERWFHDDRFHLHTVCAASTLNFNSTPASLATSISSNYSTRYHQPLEIYTILDVNSPDSLYWNDHGQLLPIPSQWSSIVLEQWRVVFEPLEVHGTTSSSFERNAHVLVRTIYTLTRLLPTRQLVNRSTTPLSISTVSGDSSLLIKGLLPLEESIWEEGAFESSSFVRLTPVATPHGLFHVTVRYRKGVTSFTTTTTTTKSSDNTMVESFHGNYDFTSKSLNAPSPTIPITSANLGLGSTLHNKTTNSGNGSGSGSGSNSDVSTTTDSTTAGGNIGIPISTRTLLHTSTRSSLQNSTLDSTPSSTSMTKSNIAGSNFLSSRVASMKISEGSGEVEVEQETLERREKERYGGGGLEIDPSSFENVELEPVPASLPPSSSSLSSLRSLAKGEAKPFTSTTATSTSGMASQRSKSLQTFATSPLAVHPAAAKVTAQAIAIERVRRRASAPQVKKAASCSSSLPTTFVVPAPLIVERNPMMYKSRTNIASTNVATLNLAQTSETIDDQDDSVNLPDNKVAALLDEIQQLRQDIPAKMVISLPEPKEILQRARKVQALLQERVKSLTARQENDDGELDDILFKLEDSPQKEPP